ncbi:hypothetical protein JCGZ_11959 [Jatropha curcas]|uniref:Aminotransferase-like plant mobile domain-containing protein n=1 Tax=Jatropha curcas TaxID=180498 RepID=A0A067KEI7_JATCU|nr:hypothetical protein JCGZ_11959 [Jatropha curcas]
MRYALMERWNDCTHSFIFGFGEMTLTPADFTTITGLGFDGDAVPLDFRYQMAALGAELVATLLGVTTCTSLEGATCRCQACGPSLYPRGEGPGSEDLSHVGTYDWASLALAHLYHGLDVWTRGSGESNWQFLRPLEAYEYRIYPGGPESDTPTETRRILRYLIHRYHTNTISEDPYHWRRYLNDRALADGYWVDRYYLGERVLKIHTATAQRRVPVAPPCHMCTLDGMTPEDRLLEYGGFPADDYLVPGDYASYLSTRLKTSLPDVREYSQDRKRHRTPASYEVQAEVGTPTGPTGVVLGDVPFPLGMEVPAQRYQELYQRFCFARTYIARLYPERHEMELEIGRLRRHQARQAVAVSRLQMENDRLRTRLEVEGIPLDFSDEEEGDDDDSSSDDAPPLPPSSVRQAAAGPSRRRR